MTPSAWRGQCWSAEDMTWYMPWCVCACVCVRKRESVSVYGHVGILIWAYTNLWVYVFMYLITVGQEASVTLSDHWEVRMWRRVLMWAASNSLKTEWVRLDAVQTGVCLTQTEKQRERLWQSEPKGLCPHWSRCQREGMCKSHTRTRRVSCCCGVCVCVCVLFSKNNWFKMVFYWQLAISCLH